MNAQTARLEFDESMKNHKNNIHDKQATALRSTMTQKELMHKTKELERLKRMVKELNEKIKEFENEIKFAQSHHKHDETTYNHHKHDETTHNLRAHHHKRVPMVSIHTFQQFQKAVKHKHVHAFGENAN